MSWIASVLRRSAAALATAAALALVLGPAPVAGAASVAYIDGGEVWVASLDGAQRARLSAGEGDWRAVAAADNGRVLGVRLEAGKISQLAKIQLWESSGAVISQGPLPYENIGWSSYVAPLGLDLSADGVFLAYGYSGYTGVVPNAFFYSGHNVVNADTKTLLQPIGQGGYKWPTMFGSRVVAAQGSQSAVQLDGSGPFGTTFFPLADVSGTGLDLERTDVAATGRMLAFDLSGANSTGKIGLVSISGVEPSPVVGQSVDCFIPAAGRARDGSLSQDGARLAWRDDEGVKVAGVPTTLADPCAFSTPPVLISATGSYPSIGGSDVATLRPPVVPPASPASPGPVAPPATGSGPATGSPAPVVTLPSSLSAGKLAGAAGVALKVRVGAAGKVKVAGYVKASSLGLKGSRLILVATGSATAKRAGTVTVRLRLTKRSRRYRARLRWAKLVLRITHGGRTTKRTVRLR